MPCVTPPEIEPAVRRSHAKAVLRSGVIGVVVVNWKTWRLTLECLQSLRTTEGAEWHLYLVDNASPDDSAAHLSDLGDDVTFIQSPVNSGWSGGNNLGVRAALADGCDRIFLLNSDAKVRPDTLAKLAAFAAKAGNAIIGPVHSDDAGTNLDFIGARLDHRTGLPIPIDGSEAGVEQAAPDYATPYIRGAGIFASREHFEHVGFFDDRYYLNYDETDWCYRAQRAGVPVRMLASAQIVHTGSASIGGAESPLNVYFLTRNGLLFSQENCSPRQRLAHAADTLRKGLAMTQRHGRAARFATLLFSRSPQLAAYRAGLRDYALRRFGDCSARIRTLRS